MYEKQSRNTNRSSDTIASFLLKTYQILEHPEYERMISWDKNNVGFIIHDVVSFTREILPKYFRHSNFSSFVRQLNMYDFHKVKQQNESLVFKNPLFCKGEQQNLKFIRRKAAKKVGGQRKQQTSDKNDVQNQKYQNLLKGFKKSFESEINQSSLFYERSIQLIKDLNESNLRKQSYIGKLYESDTKFDTTEEIKKQDPIQNRNNSIQTHSKPRKDTIIQIPKELLQPQQCSAQKQCKLPQKQTKQVIDLNKVMLLKQQVYKSLGVCQSWLQDYIQIHKKKIKYINGYRQQLIKCRQTKNNDNASNNDGQNQGENQIIDPNQPALEQKAISILKENIQSSKAIQSNIQGNNSSPKKLDNFNLPQPAKNSSFMVKTQSKPNLSAIKLFEQPPITQRSEKKEQTNGIHQGFFLPMIPKKDSSPASGFFSTFLKLKEQNEAAQQENRQSQQSQCDDGYIDESQNGNIRSDYGDQDEHQI